MTAAESSVRAPLARRNSERLGKAKHLQIDQTLSRYCVVPAPLLPVSCFLFHRGNGFIRKYLFRPATRK